MSEWLLRNRVPLVITLNIVSLLVFSIGAGVHGIAVGRMVYVWLLLGLCSLPFTFMQTFSGRYALLQIFSALYFLRYAAMDTQALLIGEALPHARAGFLTPGELVILVGGVLYLIAYLVTVRRCGIEPATRPRADWPQATALVGGLTFWTLGSAAAVVLQVFLAPDKSNMTNEKAFTLLGPLGTLVFMMGYLLGPLGLLMLAYGYARYKGVLWTLLIVSVLLLQVSVACVTDIKGTAGVLVIVLVRLLVDNKPPAGWITAGIVFVIVAFPVFQAYRMQITGERGLDRRQAFSQIGEVFAIAWGARDKAQEIDPNDRAPTFIERADLKDNVEQIVRHAGVDVVYLHGSTLAAIPLAFVPRILMPDKQTVTAEQLYNHLIGHGSDDTYISLTHLGELYWNFGWLGVLLGMPLIGVLMGYIAGRFNLESGATLTRVMVLLCTVQELCIFFEVEIATPYVVWMRSMVAIGLLHLVFARRTGLERESDDHDAAVAATLHPMPLLARYPNVLS
jgi:hypothetical protein